jgi:hypothetical protein
LGFFRCWLLAVSEDRIILCLPFRLVTEEVQLSVAYICKREITLANTIHNISMES